MAGGLGGVHGRGHAWQGVCMVGEGGMCGGGACVAGGHAWQGACMAGGHAWQGGMHGRGHVWQGACMAGGHSWQILRDVVNEWVVRILLVLLIISS